MAKETVVGLDTRVAIVENQLKGNGRKGIFEIVEDMDKVVHDILVDVTEIKNRKMFFQDTRTRIAFWITVVGFLVIQLGGFIYLIGHALAGP